VEREPKQDIILGSKPRKMPKKREYPKPAFSDDATNLEEDKKPIRLEAGGQNRVSFRKKTQ
jgi:hypothetical protein